MRDRNILIGVVLTVVVFAVLIAIDAHSQSSLTLSPGGLLSACPLPSVGSKALVFCNVANDPANVDGVYVSANGAAWFRVANAAVTTPDVKSFKGRTGDVLPAQNDYSYSQLSSPPTKISCNVAALSTGTTGKFDASQCTLTP